MTDVPIRPEDWQVGPRDVRTSDQNAVRAIIAAQSLDAMDLEAARHRIKSNMQLRLQVAARDEEIKRLRDLIGLMMPTNVCVTNTNIPDDHKVHLEISMGELRQIHAALDPQTGGGTQSE